MATIAICVFPVPSVIGSAIALAKRLRRRGHRVCILSTPDVEDSARAADIEFVPMLTGLFRSGSYVAERHYFATLSPLARLRELRRLARSYRSIMDGLLESGPNEIDQAFDRVGPDLVLFYSDVPHLVVALLVALRRGLRCAYVTPLFYSYRGPGSPPLGIGLVPGAGVWGRWSVRAAWACFLMYRSVRRRIRIAIGCDVDLARYVSKLAPTKGAAGSPVNWNCFLAPQLSLPEFFLAPRELEFPFEPRDGSHWLGWCVDGERPAQTFPFGRIDQSRPLVYCALGTQSYVFQPALRRRAFLQAVIDALAARPHLQLVLATGGDLGPDDLEVRAPDAIVLDRMPQLEVLSRARLMITHCGLYSLMESASRGVPMIAFPLGFDQFGNSARVVYHGLGVRAAFRHATAESIGRLIDAVLGDEAMSRRCAAMAVNARNHEADEAAMAALEALAARSRTFGSAASTAPHAPSPRMTGPSPPERKPTKGKGQKEKDETR